jgi:hypothetical protein
MSNFSNQNQLITMSQFNANIPNTNTLGLTKLNTNTLGLTKLNTNQLNVKSINHVDTMDLFIKQPSTNVGYKMWPNFMYSFDNKDYMIQMLMIIIFILLLIVILLLVKKNGWSSHGFLTNSRIQAGGGNTIDYFTNKSNKLIQNKMSIKNPFNRPQLKNLSNKPLLKNVSTKTQSNIKNSIKLLEYDKKMSTKSVSEAGPKLTKSTKSSNLINNSI